jgi:hypothetical protein
MDILISVTAVVSSVGGLAVGLMAAYYWRERRSRWFRSRYDIPDILGRWNCKWYDDDLPEDQPRVEDQLEIEGWLSDGEFVARGIQAQFHLVYPLVGEIDPSRIITLTYKAARYPYEPNRGVVLLEVTRDGQTMQGRWYGRRFSGKLGGGRVVCVRAATAETNRAAG